MIALQTGFLGEAITLPGVHAASLGESMGRMVIAFVVLFVVGYAFMPKISVWLQKLRHWKVHIQSLTVPKEYAWR